MKKLHKKLIITKLPHNVSNLITNTEEKHEKISERDPVPNNIITALFEDDVLVELSCETENKERILGNIYIGKVKNIVANISAAFIEIEKGIQCYYSFEDNKRAIFTSGVNHEGNHQQGKTKLKVGDELLVQVSKENIKTKAPMVTSNLNFSGRYIVLTTGNRKIGVSNKLSEKHKTKLRSILEEYESPDYGFIIRTNAKNAGVSEIQAEITKLIAEYREVVGTAPYRTCFSLLKKQAPEYLDNLKNIYIDGFQEIITDCDDLHENITEFMKFYDAKETCEVKLYRDDLLPLWKLYSLETHLKDALKERVWLKSGGYLVIQPTEALVVIDINTGKYVGKKKAEETFLKINLEAAKEIARQIRLRNLSGIIIIDFIDLKEEQKPVLLAALSSYLKADPVQTTLIGMTPLNLVEITRKKVKRPLKETLTMNCPTCHGAGYLY